MKSTAWSSYTKYLRNGEGLFMLLSKLGMKRSTPDDVFLRHVYKAHFGKELDLDHPRTFNEKLQWLKLHDRNPLYTTLVDKYEVKDHVARIIGPEFIIPTLAVWNSVDEIDFRALPNQFVLKCTHDSSSVAICRDKRAFDERKARNMLARGLRKNFYWRGREWPYKDVKPRILAEQYMEDAATRELRDYKFFAFDGVVRALFVASDRQNPNEETKFDFFDAEFRHLPFTNGHPNATSPIAPPKNFELMKTLAAKLSQGIPHVRVDFYEVNGKVYFGELTFSHWSGFIPFDPEEWDYTFGSWLTLPSRS